MTSPATAKQVAFITSLCNDRQVPAELVAQKDAELDVLTASALIDSLLKQPKKVVSHTKATEGVYIKEGTIYAVATARKGYLVCKRLYPYTAADGSKRGRFLYAGAMIYKLTDADKISVAEAEKRSLALGFCIVCGKTLTAPDSVAKSIGPVCIKKFALTTKETSCTVQETLL